MLNGSYKKNCSDSPWKILLNTAAQFCRCKVGKQKYGKNIQPLASANRLLSNWSQVYNFKFLIWEKKKHFFVPSYW